MSTSVAGSFGVCMEIINNYHTLYIWGGLFETLHFDNLSLRKGGIFYV